MESKTPRILIIGAGFAGIFCAKKLDKLFNGTAEITIVSPSPHFEYHAALYKVLNDASPLQACIPIEKILKSTKVSYVQDKIVRFDPKYKIAFGEQNDKYHFDYALVALGGENADYGIPGISKYSHSFRSINDALRLSHHIHESIEELAHTHEKRQLAFTIVGGGPAGIEIAAELAEHIHVMAINHHINPATIHIELVEGMQTILPMLKPEDSQKVKKRLEELGVHVLTNTSIKEEIKTGLITENDTIKTNTVIWVAGTKANHLYQEWGFPTGKAGRVVTDQNLQVTTPLFSQIFVAGDGAQAEGSGQAWPAIKQGEIIAQNIYNHFNQIPLLTYVAPEPKIIIPVGSGWAVSKISNNTYWSGAADLIYQLTNLKFYLKLLPLNEAWNIFTTRQEMCSACTKCENYYEKASLG